MTDPKSIGENNYESFAERYAQIVLTKPHNAYYERPATLSLLPDVSGQPVLDAGCGPGIYAEILLERGADLTAIDVTPAFVELTRQRVGQRARVLRADLNQPLDFAADDSFYVVLCPLVLDYIADWTPTFREFYRVLRPGGMLIFSCGHPLGDWLYAQRYIEVSYFETQQFTAEWSGFGEPRPVVTSYRRPISAMLDPLLTNGFALDKLLEPLPTEDFKAADPERYEHLQKQPGFVCIRAVKPG